MAAKQRTAARDFSDERSFSMALVVLNKRGERRRGARAAQVRRWERREGSCAHQICCCCGAEQACQAAVRRSNHPCHSHSPKQEFYFAPRHASSALGELACTRCCLHIARRQPYWVDRAAPSWSQVRSHTAGELSEMYGTSSLLGMPLTRLWRRMGR